MENQELERACKQLEKIGADWALLSSPENVTYVSHYDVPIEFGALANLSYGPVLALFGVKEPGSYLIANNYYAGGAKNQTTFNEIVDFNILQIFEPFQKQNTQNNFLEAIRKALRLAGLAQTKARLAVEARTLPLEVARLLMKEFSNLEIIEASPAVEVARRTKTEREIGLLKAVAGVVNVAHKELRKQTLEAGKSEFELWALVNKAMHEFYGGKFFMAGELVCGPRNKTVAPGGPINYVTKPGDLVEFDISPRLNGYWADMANVLVIGAEPTEIQKKYARAARESFYAGAAKLRPGNKARDVFEAAHAAYEGYGLKSGHYIGHGIGTNVNESPWFVRSDETVLEAGMVVCIETGAYGEEATGKCEKTFVIRESGEAEIFPDFEWGIQI